MPARAIMSIGVAHEILRPLKKDSLSRTAGARFWKVTVTLTVSPFASSADSVPSVNRRRLFATELLSSSKRFITDRVPAVLAVIVKETERELAAGSTLSVHDSA